MKTKIFILAAAIFISSNLYSQSITNTLGSNGSFFIKEGNDTLLTLNENNGYLGLGVNPVQQLDLSKNIKLQVSSDTSKGIIYKGADRFIHDYSAINSLGFNTFIGVNSGSFKFNVSGINEGSNNTGIGNSSLSNLISGYNNSALGSFSLNKLITGDMNTAVGVKSQVENISGSYNTSFGFASLYDVTSGSENTAVGNGALGFVRTGYNNTSIGFNAGSNMVWGGNNIMIGSNAQATSNSVSNQITLGNNLINSLRCNVQSITSLSDMRDKKNISDLSVGLDFISKLKPRQFNWDRREWYENNVSDGSKTEEKFTAGFIAQELDEVQTIENADWLGLVNKDNPDKLEATYGNLLPVMVKAIQELRSENEKLNSKVQDLNNRSLFYRVKKKV